MSKRNFSKSSRVPDNIRTLLNIDANLHLTRQQVAHRIYDYLKLNKSHRYGTC